MVTVRMRTSTTQFALSLLWHPASEGQGHLVAPNSLLASRRCVSLWTSFCFLLLTLRFDPLTMLSWSLLDSLLRHLLDAGLGRIWWTVGIYWVPGERAKEGDAGRKLPRWLRHPLMWRDAQLMRETQKEGMLGCEVWAGTVWHMPTVTCGFPPSVEGCPGHSSCLRNPGRPPPLLPLWGFLGSSAHTPSPIWISPPAPFTGSPLAGLRQLGAGRGNVPLGVATRRRRARFCFLLPFICLCDR